MKPVRHAVVHRPPKTPMGLRPEDRVGKCAWTECDQTYTTRYPVTLCHTHVLLIWSLVDEDARKTGQVVNPPPAATEKLAADLDALGWIYYVQVGDKIKIGYTKDLQRRIAQYPPDSVLLAARPGTIRDERTTHSLLSARRAAGREWYLIHDEVLGHIAAVVRQHGKPPEIRDWKRPNPQSSRLGLAGGVL